MTRRLEKLNFFPPGEYAFTHKEMAELILVITNIRVNYHNLARVEIEAYCEHAMKQPWAREWRCISMLTKVKEHYA